MDKLCFVEDRPVVLKVELKLDLDMEQAVEWVGEVGMHLVGVVGEPVGL